MDNLDIRRMVLDLHYFHIQLIFFSLILNLASVRENVIKIHIVYLFNVCAVVGVEVLLLGTLQGKLQRLEFLLRPFPGGSFQYQVTIKIWKFDRKVVFLKTQPQSCHYWWNLLNLFLTHYPLQGTMEGLTLLNCSY